MFVFLFLFLLSRLVHRRYAPPGGQTSISLGDYVKPPVPGAGTPALNGASSPNKPQQQQQMASPPRAAVPAATAPADGATSGAGQHVGLVVCEADGLKASTVAALHQLGED